ncbi:hypothetical protein [Nostoc sp.]
MSLSTVLHKIVMFLNAEGRIGIVEGRIGIAKFNLLRINEMLY